MTARPPVITNWCVHDNNDLPDILPGDAYERVITPQKFIVLHRIIVRGPVLVRLQIGAVPDVPFELWREDGEIYQYRPKGLDERALKERLQAIGACAVGPYAVALGPCLEVRLVLRNERSVPTKPLTSLAVQEENS